MLGEDSLALWSWAQSWRSRSCAAASSALSLSFSATVLSSGDALRVRARSRAFSCSSSATRLCEMCERGMIGERGETRWGDGHFHALKLFAFALSGEKGGCTVFDESGLALAETGYVGGHKIFCCDSVGCRTRFFWEKGVMEWRRETGTL